LRQLEEGLITVDVLGIAHAQDLADECGFTELQFDADLLDDVAWRAKHGKEHVGAPGIQGNADVGIQEPCGEATPADPSSGASASRVPTDDSSPEKKKEHESGGGGGSSSSSEGDARASSTTHPVSEGGDNRTGDIIGKILRAMAATDGGKMCMHLPCFRPGSAASAAWAALSRSAWAA
jgi:hypothetical protein